MSAVATAPRGVAEAPAAVVSRAARRNAYGIVLVLFTFALLAFTKVIRPEYGPFDLETLAVASLPLALAACAQAIIVISGGIDLSIGPIMALTNVTAALLMEQAGDTGSIGVVVLVLALGLLVGAVNGFLVVASRVPDIVVTLAMSFVWSGIALLVLASPGGAAPDWFKDLADDFVLIDVIPKAFVVLVVTVGVIWLPLRRSKLGLSLYAVGSDRLAAFRSGVDVNRTKLAAYAIGGLLAACGGLAITMATGIGAPVPGNYTLGGVAAIVLGGVSLAGGRGGLLGPIAAAFILALIRVDLIFLGVDPNYSVVVQGVIMVVVVMIGGLVSLRRARR